MSRAQFNSMMLRRRIISVCVLMLVTFVISLFCSWSRDRANESSFQDALKDRVPISNKMIDEASVGLVD